MRRISNVLCLKLCVLILFCVTKLKLANPPFVLATVPTSSIWCHGNGYTRHCTVNTLCYIPNSNNEFAFVLTNISTISGLRSKSEFKTFSLSSVNNHNGLHFKFTFVSPETFLLKHITWIEYPVLLVWRFKWDNIMHVIHDDIIPIFTTYSEVCAGNIKECVNKYTLAFVDGGEQGPYYHWYEKFSKYQPMFLKKFVSDNATCFRNSRIGLSKKSIWFKYGFNEVHGQVPSVLDSLLLTQFRDFILDQFKINNTQIHQHGVACLLSRKINRKIVNENYVVRSIKKVFSNMTFVNVDVSFNDTNAILSFLMNTKLLVGMHGSAMVFSIFLPPGSTIIELFPFGIQPQHVSSTKALCSLPNVQYDYLEWRNWNEINSVAHPEYPPLLGGIHHLSKEKQEEITRIKLVPPVHCCHNPIYLYRMYQDTIVDSSFVAVLEQALNNQVSNSEIDFKITTERYLEERWYFPGPVNNIKCKTGGKQIIILWDPPLNLEGRLADYKVSVAITGKQGMSIVTHECKVEISIATLKQQFVKAGIWILARVGHEESVDSYADCNVTRH